MNGSHWVATYVKDRVINYFDSFGMPPFREIVNRTKEKNLSLLHQNRQIHNLYTSTCGYFCLYFLNESIKEKAHLEKTISIYCKYSVQTLIIMKSL